MKLSHSFSGVLLAATLLVPALTLATDAAAEIQIDNAYARAVPPVQPNSALFMTLKNTGSTDRALVSASSPAAETVELHNHINDGGVMRMRRVDRIEVPAGGSAELKPGGYHVMLIGLRQPLKPETRIAVELQFDDGSRSNFDAPVRSIMQMPMDHDHSHH